MTETGSSGGDSVLPFRPREEVPSHRPRSRPGGVPPVDAGADGESAPPTLAEQVSRLAARGLSGEEIRLRLGLPEALPPEDEQELEQAFRRGQIFGRAWIKEAQFEAALQGRVTAQAAVLARLGDQPGEEGGEDESGAVEVVRHILPSPAPHD